MAILDKIMKKYNELSVQTKAAFWFTVVFYKREFLL